MKIVAPEEILSEIRRSRPERRFAVRSQSGVLVYEATPHEAVLMCERGLCGGGWFKTGLRYLVLLVPPRVALAFLKRQVYATGRTIAEASQLVSRQSVCGGVVFSHIVRRTNAYQPVRRREFLASVTA